MQARLGQPRQALAKGMILLLDLAGAQRVSIPSAGAGLLLLPAARSRAEWAPLRAPLVRCGGDARGISP